MKAPNNSPLKLISVVLPTHNNEKYVGRAIQSILEQTYKNIELLILISADSNQESLDIINSFSDGRIRQIYRDKPDNLPKCLNFGLQEARGEYVARMDSDDISLPDRLETQLRFMDNHPTIGLSGSWYKSFGHGPVFVNKLYTDPEDIKANFLFYTSLAHPTVMFRKTFLDKFDLRYDETLNCTEDYDLWVRSSDYFPVANIDKVLLLYRVHSKSAYHRLRQEAEKNAAKIRIKLLKGVKIIPTDEEMQLHNSLTPANEENGIQFIKKEERWLTKIIESNDKNHVYNSDSLSKIIYSRWRTLCGMNSAGGLRVWKAFISSPLFYNYKQKNMLGSVKIFIKCLLRMK